jgi:hypothetical protein
VLKKITEIIREGASGRSAPEWGMDNINKGERKRREKVRVKLAISRGQIPQRIPTR